MFLKTDNILVIGGAGFIGKHLAKQCLKSSENITILDILPNKAYKGNIEFINADLNNKSQLEKALKGKSFDYVFNCGGSIDHTAYLKGGRKVIEAHYIGLLNLIDSLDTSTLKGFVQVGSSDEYGASKSPQKETLREKPISPYSLAKTNASNFIQMISQTEGFPGAVVRFFLVYGPGQDEKRFLPQIIKSCLRNKEFKTSKGIQLRDFCYIEDACDAMITAAVSDKSKGHIINVASGKPVKIKDMIETIMKITGGGKPIWGAHPYRPGENMELYADISLAKEILNWSPKITVEEGLKRTIEYYKNINK